MNAKKEFGDMDIIQAMMLGERHTKAATRFGEKFITKATTNGRNIIIKNKDTHRIFLTNDNHANCKHYVTISKNRFNSLLIGDDICCMLSNPMIIYDLLYYPSKSIATTSPLAVLFLLLYV